MSEKKEEHFSSRLGLILSLMGVAVGAGNIWRFSRIVAQNGGGSFIIPWIIFIFIWSIPLVIAEIALGKRMRRAPIGSVSLSAGPKFGWMGAFIALVTSGILFYYSVVVGWGMRYFLYSATGTLVQSTNTYALWDNFVHSLQPVYFHLVAIVFGCIIVYKGINRGIEKSNKVLMPTLFAIILIIAVRAITLPGAWEGINYLFTPHLEDLLNYRIWLQALTQNAWDTGAGWGLLLVYAGYASRKESVTVNGALTVFGNNTISLIMGMTIFSTVFALENHLGIKELISGEGSTNVGLTFIYLPKLFQALPGGSALQSLFATLFFLGFVFAAFSSIVSMLQLTSQIFHELGLKRLFAVILTGLLALLFGAPSALSMSIFENQDWVWSIGLIVNGLFIAFAVMRYGIDKFRKEAINSAPGDFKLGRGYNWIICFLIPGQGLLLIGWYFYQSLTEMDAKWFNPLHINSLGTILFQWGIGLALFILLNKWIVKKSIAKETL